MANRDKLPSSNVTAATLWEHDWHNTGRRIGNGEEVYTKTFPDGTTETLHFNRGERKVVWRSDNKPDAETKHIAEVNANLGGRTPQRQFAG